MKTFYVGVGAIIEKDEKLLVLKCSPEKDFGANEWEVVTGRLELDENPENGILREVQEEVKLNVEIIMPVDTGFFYRGGKEFPMIFIVFWCRYKGGEVELSWEHSEYKWISIHEATSSESLKPFTKSFSIIKELKKHLPKEINFSKT